MPFFVGKRSFYIPNTVEVAPTYVHVSLNLDGFGENTIYQDFGQNLSTVFVTVIARLVGNTDVRPTHRAGTERVRRSSTQRRSEF